MTLRFSGALTGAKTLVMGALLAGVAGLAPAQAADLGGYHGGGSIKDAPVAYERPALANWGGLYFGGSIGYGWNEVSHDYTPFQTIPPQVATHVHSSRDGGLLGGHVGIQHQIGRIVVGAEAGWSGNQPFGNSWSKTGCFNDATLGQDANYSCQSKVNSIFTIGPRLGYAFDRYMFFVTGGWASAQVQTREYGNCNFGCTVVPGNHFDWSKRHDGWFLGAGAEMLVHDRWVLGLEYQHIDLNSAVHYPGGFPGEVRRVDADEDILRFRVSYKIGRETAAPAYAPGPLK